MAQVPTTGTPSVAPSASPTPGQNISPSPAAFGANVVGEGLQDAGKAAGETADLLAQHATQLYAIYNKQAADAAGYDTAQKIDKMAADFRTNNTEMQAVNNYPAFVQQVQQVRDEGGAHLSTMANVDYESLSRRYTYGAISQVGAYSTEQGNKARIDSSDALAGQVGHNFATNPTPENEALAVETWGKAAHQILGPAGLAPNDPQIKQQILKWSSPAYATIIANKFSSGDLAGANALLEQKKDMLSDEAYRQLSGGLRTANQANTIQTGSDVLINGGDWSPSVGGNSSYLAAVHGREGTGQNPGSSATGVGQFTRDTWLGLLHKDPEFAQDAAGKTDTQLLALRNTNPQLADRMILAYGRQNIKSLPQGVSATNANIGVMHGYGPGWGASILAASPDTPVESIIGASVAAKNGVSGQTTGQVIAAFTTRFGTGAFDPTNSGTPVHFAPLMQPTSGTDPKLYLDNVENELQQRVLLAAPGNSEMQHQLLSSAIAKVELKARTLADGQSASYDVMDKWVIANSPKSINEVKSQFPMDYANAPAKYQAALNNSIKTQNAVLTPERQDNDMLLAGMYAHRGIDPAPFQNADIQSMDLTGSARQKYMDLQAKSKSGGPAPDNLTVNLMKSIEVRSALNTVQQSESDKTKFNAHTFQFAGALEAEVKLYQAQNPGKIPQGADLNRIVMGLVAKQGDAPRFEVPPDKEAALRQGFATRRNLNPTDRDIGEAYWHSIRRQGG